MRRLFPLWLALALLPAISFLWQDGYFGSSDGMIHLYRLFELDRGLHAGILFPRWFPLSGYGYGLPVLNYYPPLAYYLPECFHLLGAGYILAIKLTIASGFIVAALSMFLFARELIGDGAAFIAGVAYAYLPYLLSDAYIRGNIPEFLAMSLIPLALWLFRRVYNLKDDGEKMKDESRPASLPFGHSFLVLRHSSFIHPSLVVLAALAFAAIVLTHHLTAMLFAALLLAYLAFLFLLKRDAKGLLACCAAIAIGLMLSVFYWLPSLAELDLVFVGPASVARFLVSRLTSVADFLAPSLAYSYLPQNEALRHSFGFPQTILALLAGFIGCAVVVSRRNDESNSRLFFYVIFFSLVAFVSIFMTLAPSAPLWYAVPTLRFMQFPWRFQILAGVGIAFLLGVWAMWIVDLIKRRWANWVVLPTMTGALILMGIANLELRAFPLADADVDLTRSSDSEYVVAQMGWGWTREFVPSTVSESDAIYAPVKKSDAAPNFLVHAPELLVPLNDGAYAPSFRVETTEPFELSMHTFFFPGWQAYIDNIPARTFPRGSLGLATVTVLAGEHAVVFQFENTLLRTFASTISLLAIGMIGVWLLARHRRSLLLCVVAAGVIGMLFVVHTRDANAQQPIPISATLDQQVKLVGYSSDRVGEKLTVTLYWFALREMNRDYSSFVHLVDGQGNIIAQHDGLTDQGLTPTTRWQIGEVIADRHTIDVKGIPSGEYQLSAGMYFPAAGGYQSLGERVELGSVSIRPSDR